MQADTALTALVVCESMFGNTRRLAETIAEEFKASPRIAPGGCRVVDVADARPEDVAAADLLIVGGPTHMFGASRPSSRKSVAEKWPQASVPAVGIREFVDELPSVDGRPAAAFDTRLSKPSWMTGAASRVLARALRGRGYEVCKPNGSFRVSGTEGPLVDGELEHARAWAQHLIRGLGETASELRRSHV